MCLTARRGSSRVETDADPTAHAEMLCIRGAAAVLGAWRLTDATLYVTLEPCPMCAGALLQARIARLVWGAPNALLGADGSWIRCPPLVRRGVLSGLCGELMREFFQARRKLACTESERGNVAVVKEALITDAFLVNLCKLQADKVAK
eukprot:SM000016S01913  [mRNA]  locus=s16:529270:530696:+ [translate_table: standard]